MKITTIPKNFLGFSAIISAIGITVFCVFFVVNTRPIVAAEKVEISLSRLDESVREAMENNILVKFSSNPYDFINNNSYYDSIVDIGAEALPVLEELLQSSESNGLNEYILAMAIEEIAHANVNSIWETVTYSLEDLQKIAGNPEMVERLRKNTRMIASAKEFASAWKEIKPDAENNIMTILNSPDHTVEQKLEKIKDYGILAVPSINTYLEINNINITKGKTIDSLEETLRDLIASYGLSAGDVDIIKAYLENAQL